MRGNRSRLEWLNIQGKRRIYCGYKESELEKQWTTGVSHFKAKEETAAMLVRNVEERNWKLVIRFCESKGGEMINVD